MGLLRSRKTVVLIGALLIALACYRSGFFTSHFSPESIRQFVTRFGAWSVLVYLVLYGQPIIPLPATVMAIAAGLIFGELPGSLAALFGAIIRASSQFAFARWFGRDVVRHFLGERITQPLDRHGNSGFKTVFLTRIIPNFPFDMQNIFFGLTSVSFRAYLLATAIGMIPLSFGYAFLGSAILQPKHAWKCCLAIILIICLVCIPKMRSLTKQTTGGQRCVPTEVIQGHDNVPACLAVCGSLAALRLMGLLG